jgi:hypothetical protein
MGQSRCPLGPGINRGESEGTVAVNAGGMEGMDRDGFHLGRFCCLNCSRKIGMAASNPIRGS